MPAKIAIILGSTIDNIWPKSRSQPEGWLLCMSKQLETLNLKQIKFNYS